jgi:hypothetical protein
MPTVNSWTDVLPERLRYYIGDLDSPQRYTDAILESFITLAAAAVVTEVKLINNTFTIDPIISGDVDPGIPALFVFKAGAILAMSEVRRDAAKYGVKIRDDVTSYDGTAALKVRGDSYKFYLENYEKARWAWERGNRATLKAIFGAYESANIGQTSVDFYWPTVHRR